MDFLSQSHINFEQFNLLELLSRFSLALVLSVLSGVVYSFRKGLGRRVESVIYGGVGLCLIITMILLVLSSNLFYALGLFAALSIIRFRTPVKDVHDTIHLFLCIGIGISVGAGALKTAVFGVVFILFFQSLSSFFKIGDSKRAFLVKIITAKGFDSKEDLKNSLMKKSRSLELMQAFGRKDGEMELFYEISPGKNVDSDEFVELAKNVDGVEEVLVFPAQVDMGI